MLPVLAGMNRVDDDSVGRQNQKMEPNTKLFPVKMRSYVSKRNIQDVSKLNIRDFSPFSGASEVEKKQGKIVRNPRRISKKNLRGFFYKTIL